MHIFDGNLKSSKETIMILLAGCGRENVVRVKSEIDRCIAKNTDNILLWNQFKLPVVHKTTLNSLKVCH